MSSLRYNAVPVQLHWRQKRRLKSKVLVICDVSSSVRDAARFLLQFLYAMTDVLPRVRSFAFAARFDEVTGEPLRAWGRGIDVGPLNSEADAINAVRAFVGRNAQAFSTSPKLLGGVLGGLGGGATANYDASQDAWYVDIPAVHEGIEVYRGGVTARFKRGKLVMIGVQTYAEVPRLGQQVLSDAEAIQTAIDLGPASGALHTNRSAELVWLPFMVDGELSLVRAWEVHSITDEPVGEWVSFVDAETGEPRPYVHVRRGLEALIARAVFYELAEMAVEEDGVWGVRSGGAFFPIAAAGKGGA